MAAGAEFEREISLSGWTQKFLGTAKEKPNAVLDRHFQEPMGDIDGR